MPPYASLKNILLQTFFIVIGVVIIASISDFYKNHFPPLLDSTESHSSSVQKSF